MTENLVRLEPQPFWDGHRYTLKVPSGIGMVSDSVYFDYEPPTGILIRLTIFDYFAPKNAIKLVRINGVFYWELKNA